MESSVCLIFPGPLVTWELDFAQHPSHPIMLGVKALPERSTAPHPPIRRRGAADIDDSNSSNKILSISHSWSCPGLSCPPKSGVPFSLPLLNLHTRLLRLLPVCEQSCSLAYTPSLSLSSLGKGFPRKGEPLFTLRRKAHKYLTVASV